MPMWRIYYADSYIDGETEVDWKAAPDGVQVVVLFEAPEVLCSVYSGGPVRDRQLWTGTDTYDPFGWGEKQGSLIDSENYFAIWERACGDNRSQC